MPDMASERKEQPIPSVEAGASQDVENGLEQDELVYEQEQAQEKEAAFLETEESKVTPVVAKPSATPAAAPVAKQRTEEFIRVEKILEDGLGPFYATLPETAKPKFKQKGEQATEEISTMVGSMKLNLKRVLQLIRDWLLTIPKVNKFFLEQEAKIKTDKIAELVKDMQEERLPRT